MVKEGAFARGDICPVPLNPARPLFALDWPALLSRDLEELRRELGVVPVREGPASWMSRPELMAALA